MALEIDNLHVNIGEKKILQGITLEFTPGKIHALMGPNGSGKSTLAHTIMGRPGCSVTQGRIVLDGVDITAADTTKRAQLGLFLSFQYPPEIPGVSISTFLRSALNSRREKKLSVVEFHTLLKEKMQQLHIDPSFSRRNLHEGFSGGEKKKLEMLQLALLKPKYVFLDETDSGLDVDAIKVVSELIHTISKDTSIIVITHYNAFLAQLSPDTISVLMGGKIVAQGGAEIAAQIEKDGFGAFEK